MRLSLAALCLLVLACNPSGPAGTDSGTASSTTDTGATTAASEAPLPTTTDAETGATSTGPGLDDHGPCAGGQLCPGGGVCVELDGASVCGPACYEKGPGFVRCPASAIQEQTICPWLEQGGVFQTAPCLISCTVAADCPDPAMVCLPCPAQFAADCPLGAAFGRGPDMCAWPDP